MTKLEKNLQARETLSAAAIKCASMEFHYVFLRKIEELEFIASKMTIEEAHAHA